MGRVGQGSNSTMCPQSPSCPGTHITHDAITGLDYPALAQHCRSGSTTSHALPATLHDKACCCQHATAALSFSQPHPCLSLTFCLSHSTLPMCTTLLHPMHLLSLPLPTSTPRTATLVFCQPHPCLSPSACACWVHCIVTPVMHHRPPAVSLAQLLTLPTHGMPSACCRSCPLPAPPT